MVERVERVRSKRALLPVTPLLPTDSREEFDRVLEAIWSEVRPNNIIEVIFTEDVAYFAWEIRHTRRWKVGIISAAFLPALENILDRLMQPPGDSRRVYIGNPKRVEAEAFAGKWFTDEGAKEEILEFLAPFQLDESAIEAEAFGKCAEKLEKIDRLEASYEARLQKALRQVFEYRNEFGLRLRDASKRIIDGKALALDDSTNKKPRADA
jgi:hypothetical protein